MSHKDAQGVETWGNCWGLILSYRGFLIHPKARHAGGRLLGCPPFLAERQSREIPKGGLSSYFAPHSTPAADGYMGRSKWVPKTEAVPLRSYAEYDSWADVKQLELSSTPTQVPEDLTLCLCSSILHPWANPCSGKAEAWLTPHHRGPHGEKRFWRSSLKTQGAWWLTGGKRSRM